MFNIRLNPFRDHLYLTGIGRRYAWSMPIVAVTGLLAGLLEGVGIGLLIPMVASLLAAGNASSGGVIALLGRFGEGLGHRERLFLIGGAMIALLLVKNAVQVFSRIFIAYIDGRASNDVRLALVDRLLSVGYSFHLSQDPIRFINIVATESWRASEAMRAGFSRVVSLATILVFAVMLVLVSWQLTLFVAAGAVIVRLVQAGLTRKLGALSELSSLGNQVLAERMVAVVDRIRVIRLFKWQATERQRFATASDHVRRVMLAQERVSSTVSPVLEVLHAMLFIGILLAAVLYGYSLPVLAAFLVLLNRLQPHLRALEAASTDLESAAANVAEVEWLLDPRGKPPAPTGETSFAGLSDRIEFRNVSFAYPTRTEAAALTDVSFSIPAGKATALMGRSGSGKSTIINLLCRLVDPAGGCILVDGTDLTEIDPASWLDHIGIAGQDIDLVDGTIADNITFGRSDLSEADIVEAARAADAHDFITALPQGYQTDVGDGGSSLSGGQRQRIAIARAFARKPSILILDEATNAVDGISEAAILGLLRQVRGDMTVIVISHRHSTIAQCDHAVSLSNGRVVEESPLAESQSYRGMVGSEKH